MAFSPPIRSLGYCLNKKDFRDRYNWPIPDVCKHCACGMKNSVDHALSCKKGGMSLSDMMFWLKLKLNF